MNVTGVPTLLVTRQLQSQVTEIKAQLDDVREEAVTGLTADVVKKTDGDVATVHQIEKLLDDSESYADAIAVTGTRLEVAQETLTAIREDAGTLGVRIESALGLENEVAVQTFADEARALLASAFSKLNGSIGGQSLFAGAATDGRALADVEVMLADLQAIISATSDPAIAMTNISDYFESPAGGFQTNIYLGSDDPEPDREVAQGRRIGLDVTAADPGLRDMLRGLAVAALVDDPAIGDEYAEALLAHSAEKINEGSNEIVRTQGQVGLLQGELLELEASNRSLTFSLQEAMVDLIGEDQATAAAKMRELELQLEASYLTTARMQQLSILNYLR